MALQRSPNVMDDYHQFKIGSMHGYATARIVDRVNLTINHSPDAFTNMTLSATEARAMANALYEAADASEKVLPVAAAAVAS